MFITMATALYNTHTPDELRGRVMGLSTVVVQGGMSLGTMLIGSLGAVIGIGAALSVGGGVFAASAATGLVRSAGRPHRIASAAVHD
jgi:ENTS family enterobactin (siderophore) exporter